MTDPKNKQGKLPETFDNAEPSQLGYSLKKNEQDKLSKACTDNERPQLDRCSDVGTLSDTSVLLQDQEDGTENECKPSKASVVDKVVDQEPISSSMADMDLTKGSSGEDVSSNTSKSKDDSSKTGNTTPQEFPPQLAHLALYGLPYVDIKKDVQMEYIIECPFAGSYTKCGSGWHAKWQGRTVAVKRYDDYSFHRFEREVRNYHSLQEVWGELIPTPYFISFDEAEGYAYLGMQLAQSPAYYDDLSAWYGPNGPYKQLRKRFGFVHCSSGSKHCKILPSEKPGEPDKLITIDLENHYWA